ncbi:MAG: hypothetical protein A2289_19475 [Deltaproteobacteria bacterium RIFOXYA12_FULL_58_15]|nr:MAG: hypothetical protein A2289_19475 [Deltaproteobacteria bacterium RIFOXYA12_FULL_58_15]OGR14974.1 MAG: hypothetical protein A2341_17690 [Deltaproteobacteria bacterium RIFOXYB12_FULL_58_9]
MGHIAAKAAYHSLQKRLDMMPIGAPLHRALIELLELLFTPEECRVAAAIPLRLAKLKQIANNAGLPEKRTAEILDSLANKGLVVDFPRPNGAAYYYLNPTVIGFFEFTMMRVRDDVDQKQAAKLIWSYMFEDPQQAFLGMMTGSDTFIARPLVHETALDPQVYSEVLDYEKASAIIDSGTAWGESICHCRHVKHHQGKPCKHPMGHCLTVGRAGDWLIRRGMAKSIPKERALEIINYSYENGLVLMTDNIKDQPGFICNCCKCCCEMMGGMRLIPEAAKVVSSNYVAAMNPELCNGCGKCAKACPIDAVEMVPAAPTEAAPKRTKRASLDIERCLGCSVCYRECKFDGIRMLPAKQRVYTPENMMERMALQAIERGKLQHLLFNDPGKLSHRVLGSLLDTVVRLPPAKQALANKQLKSKFVTALLGRVTPKSQEPSSNKGA